MENDPKQPSSLVITNRMYNNKPKLDEYQKYIQQNRKINPKLEKEITRNIWNQGVISYKTIEKDIKHSIKLVEKDEKIYDFQILKIKLDYILAIVIKNTILFYVLDSASGILTKLKKKTIYLEGAKEQDSFYTCSYGLLFLLDDNEIPHNILAVAGKQAIIYLIDLDNNFETKTLIGNVNDIYDLAFAPFELNEKNKNLLLSCCKDTSIMLWNIRTQVQIAIFKTGNNPPADTLSIDWHRKGDKFVVANLDGSIKIWTLEDRVIENIDKASSWTEDPYKFPRMDIKKPTLATYNLHSNYSDNARFWGDFIASKDVEGHIILWHYDTVGNVYIYGTYTYPIWESIWFVKFAVDQKYGLISIGNDNGEIFIYKINYSNDSKEPMAKFNLSSQTVIRKAMFTNGLKYLLAATDDGRLWVIDLSDKIYDVFKEQVD